MEQAEIVAELRGRCAALESFIIALLWSKLQTGPQQALMQNLLIQTEENLLRARLETTDEEAGRAGDYAITAFQDITLKVLASLPNAPGDHAKN